MTLSTRYNPKETEDKWYQHWMDKNYFHSEPDDREAFSIVIPPPNVTGVLHMGHMLNNTIQDILIRHARLKGKNACWVPGTDHASIATEAKVVKMLREQGIKKSEIGREEFMKYAWEWKEKYGGIILEQLKKLGASCDWERTRFTLDPSLSKAVVKVFIDLYQKGKLYRANRITNWDPEAKTVLSNEEVLYSDENSKLYHVRYKVEFTEDEWVTIATTRPETILGDTAVAVHPDDERYTHLKGQKVLVPLINRAVPIIFDTYVEREFGTGALKVTPAHDANDYDIGQRHELEVVDIFNEDGTMSDAAQLYIGMDRFAVRKLIVKDLEKAGHIVKIEDYKNKIGRSERTGVVVEPRLTLQWFLDMKEFAGTALNAVKDGEVKFYPEHFWNMFNSWLKEDNIRDWCISRQLWWGQQIPAYYLKGEISTDELVFVAESAEEALQQAIEKTGNKQLSLSDLRQEEDVVDTWFSSWLWPISVFDGFESPEELKYYYPTSVLVTAWDIMFFWVARMIMAGYEWAPELLGADFVKENGKQPFDSVYFTGMVRDNQRRKMSKQLGNSPDALTLIETYGADGVRFGVLSSASAGNDIIFDAPYDKKTKTTLNESKLCEQGRNFCNKMWNALRLVKGWNVTDEGDPSENGEIHHFAISWFEEKFYKTIATLETNIGEYRFSDALMGLYSFIWSDFCSWYLEMIKPAYGQPIDKATFEKTIGFFEKLMTALHPFMPFVTEEIWHQLRDRNEGEDCIISGFPIQNSFDNSFLKLAEEAKDVVTKVRDIRNTNGIKMKEELALYVNSSKSAGELMKTKGLKEMLVKLAVLSDFSVTDSDKLENTVSFLSGTDKFFVEINKSIDVEAECKRLKEELDYMKGFEKMTLKKLNNERFVNNAPAVVVEKERKKLADAEAKIKSLEESMGGLGCV